MPDKRRESVHALLGSSSFHINRLPLVDVPSGGADIDHPGATARAIFGRGHRPSRELSPHDSVVAAAHDSDRDARAPTNAAGCTRDAHRARHLTGRGAAIASALADADSPRHAKEPRT
jgi:hypothetical protein